jgi:hypothetical protein
MALTFPEDNSGYPGTITFTAMAGGGIQGNSQTGANSVNVPIAAGGGSGGVTLYLPQALQISDAVEFSNTDLGLTGAAIGAAMTGQGQKEINSFLENIKDPAQAAQMQKLAQVAVAQKAGVGDAVAVSARAQVNPNTRALFKSVPLREFTFNFKLIPQSASETSTIKEIIKYLRTELYPKNIGGGSTINLGYEFPNKFKITMAYNGNPVATPIQMCYMKNFAATYNGGSMGMYADGGFSEVDIAMTFMEDKAINKEMVQSGEV